PPPSSTLFPYTTLFRSVRRDLRGRAHPGFRQTQGNDAQFFRRTIGGDVQVHRAGDEVRSVRHRRGDGGDRGTFGPRCAEESWRRSEEHTSELQSRFDLV